STSHTSSSSQRAAISANMRLYLTHAALERSWMLPTSSPSTRGAAGESRAASGCWVCAAVIPLSLAVRRRRAGALRRPFGLRPFAARLGQPHLHVAQPGRLVEPGGQRVPVRSLACEQARGRVVGAPE